MDGSFACPECGMLVEVRGLAPGRQVRCGFCRRLLEVPYLPRVADPSWRRHRFGRPGWVTWAWAALGFVIAGMVVAAAIQVLSRQERAGLNHAIQRLANSSETYERSGRFDQALVDLDAALELCRQSEFLGPDFVKTLKDKRLALAQRDASSVLSRLSANNPETFPLGDWLNLQARITSDPDLNSLKPEVTDRFHASLRNRIEADLLAARNALESGRQARALDRCEAVAPLLPHLPAGDQRKYHQEAEEVVVPLLSRYGVIVDPPRGNFVLGSEATYVATMLPTLIKGLAAKGYLPDSASSPWHDHWKHAPYLLRLVVTESLEGNYMASENRLTRIDAKLTLLRNREEIWQTMPTARTMVPLPKLPAYLSTRVALSPARAPEFERLLYDNARSLIDEKFAFAIGHMPECGAINR